MDATLTERVQALAEEAERERETLERQRQTIATEREAEVAAVQERHTRAMRAEVEQTRERFRARLDTLDADLKTTRRLARALADPPARVAKPKPTKLGPPSQAGWTPSEPVMRAVAAAVEAGHETIRAIDESGNVDCSSATIKVAIDRMREDGRMRLAGTTGGRSNAKVYRLTPDGGDWLRTSTTNGVPV